jgi:DNA ligase D-like protein (predicted 3'-phosphoesterase)
MTPGDRLEAAPARRRQGTSSRASRCPGMRKARPQRGVVADRRLEAYRAQRSGRSPEPAARRRSSRKLPIFVVQEHQASTHHFDLRIEVDGVLKSWALPRRPSPDPREKRLAVAVEDHPLDYADFEGVIPTDEYGGGAVIVWDRGSYDNLTEQDGRSKPVADALEDGHLVIDLHGQKLRGGYALQRISGGEKAKWLLIKIRDGAADARRRPISTRPRSVLSGRTVEQVALSSHDDG